MFQSIWDDIKREFQHGNMVTRLIIINVAFFVAIKLIWIILRISFGWSDSDLYLTIARGLMFSSDWIHDLTHPWTILTYMFFHEGIFHILWNMLIFYWFGRIVGDLIGNQRIWPMYLLGGAFGGLAFFIAYNIFPLGSPDGPDYMLGASGAVMAIVVASAVLSPDYVMRLLFLGDVKLKYIVGAILFLDLIGVAGDHNTGGHFAHLGGALMGWLFVLRLREGADWSRPINRVTDAVGNFFAAFFGRSNKGLKVKKDGNSNYRNRKSNRRSSDKSQQERVDAILDKIRASGYESLTDEEKEFLFNASKD